MSAPVTVIHARERLRALGVGELLSRPRSNPKVAKAAKLLGVLSAPLHLAPARLSGHNVCPMSTPGCRAACLHTAGNPATMAGKSRARLARTRAYFADRAAFLAVLVDDVARLERRARRKGMQCAVRLNATSDIKWERVPVTRDGAAFPNIMAAFPGVQFYDYTKIANRRGVPGNYHLTFSLAENNARQALEAYARGFNVSAVFNVPRGAPLPRALTLEGVTLPVIDGDVHDYRPADPPGSIVGLRAKGAARLDVTGFARDIPSRQ